MAGVLTQRLDGWRSIYVPRSVPILKEVAAIVRPVLLSVIALAAGALALAAGGLHGIGLVLGGVLVLVSGVSIWHVWRSVGHMCRQSHDTRRAAKEAEKHYIEVLRRMMHIVEAREAYAGGHSERIGQMSGQIASKLGLPEEQCEMLRIAGELHDIGLLAIPDGILKTHSRYGSAEFRTVQRHSETSYEILLPLESLQEVLPAIRYHHERMNGTGYPEGLEGDRIPLGARIIAVADAYDAMTHDRPHRAAMTSLEAVQELRRCAPAGYDEGCVEALGTILNAGDLAETMSPGDAVPA
jgi:HD-GYP domain-containing protein (c-di-GMP phosphodiesterase class II)